jgi:NAD+ kinase
VGAAVRRVGFAFNPTSDPAVELKDRAMAWASLHGVDHWAAPAADREGLHRELADTDLLVVLGGDGTFLRAARAVVRDDVPLLGINVGKVGFLSKVEAADLEKVLELLLAGRFTLEPRMALEGRILRAGNALPGDQLVALEIELPDDLSELAGRLEGWSDTANPRNRLGV